MNKQTTQVHNISPEDFKNEIVAEIKKELQELTKALEAPPPDELIDSNEACSILGISKPTLLSYRKQNIVLGYKFGRKVRYRRGEIFAAAKAINYKKQL